MGFERATVNAIEFLMAKMRTNKHRLYEITQSKREDGNQYPFKMLFQRAAVWCEAAKAGAANSFPSGLLKRRW